LIGDVYSLSTYNFPQSFGQTIEPESQTVMNHGSAAVSLRFDGTAENAGNLRVNERVVTWDGRDDLRGVQAAGIEGMNEFELTEWANEGEVMEFSFVTRDGSYLADDPDGQSGYTIRGLNWANSEPNSQPELFESGFYFYFDSARHRSTRRPASVR
jgi:hypothetical protein